MILQTEAICQSSMTINEKTLNKEPINSESIECKAIENISLDSEPNQSWQQQLADVIRDPAELFALLQLDEDDLPEAIAACKDFPLRVPRPYLKRINIGDPNDPLLKQVLPVGKELEYQPGFNTDPLEESDCNPIPGLIHKYHGRVLLIISSGCAINCRYCFRRHFPYSDNNPSKQQWDEALTYIADNKNINEVIFSGGDPLAASDALLADIVDRIATIEHVKTLRIHSRLPIVIPKRINNELLNWLTRTRLKPVFVIHCNHPNELDGEVKAALRQLQMAGVTLLNQSVLLKGVNDNVDTLKQLSEGLFECNVLPYYLHILDKVQGAAHFDVNEEQAALLMKELINQLPGYLIPKLVREQPKALAKVPIPLL